MSCSYHVCSGASVLTSHCMAYLSAISGVLCSLHTFAVTPQTGSGQGNSVQEKDFQGVVLLGYLGCQDSVLAVRNQTNSGPH